MLGVPYSGANSFSWEGVPGWTFVVVLCVFVLSKNFVLDEAAIEVRLVAASSPFASDICTWFSFYMRMFDVHAQLWLSGECCRSEKDTVIVHNMLLFTLLYYT